MKQNKLFLGLATLFAAAFTFTACSSDDAESQSALQDRTIRLTSSVERGSTRATSDPQSGTSLSTSSNLAIWAINTTADPDAALTNGNNEQYSVDNSGNLTPKTTANTMTWPDGATLNFYAYAPYNSGYSYNSANNFSVATDQSTETNYLASDLVLAQTTDKTYDANTPVALTFKHLMSKINITINKASGASVDLTKAKVTITNTKLKTNFKPSATDEESDKILTDVTADNEAADILAVSALGTATTACAIIVPQQIAAGTALVKIETTSEATSGANRTLVAKLSETTTFESGQSYNFTITVNDATPGTTEEVDLELGSATLAQWGDRNLGAVTEEVYVAGDYVLKDGTLVHKADLTNDQKANVRAIVFTYGADDLSTEDKAAGYVGYAMSVIRMGNKKWCVTDTYETAPSTYAESLGMINGRTKTATLQSAWSSNDSWGSAFVNFTNFTSSSNSLDANSLVTSESGNKNLSGWFAPAFGQMVQILNNLGEAGITKDLEVTFSAGNGNFYTTTSTTALSTINSLVQTDLGKENAIFSNGYVFTTVTENGDKFFYVKVNDSNLNIGLGKTAGKNGDANRSVLPIVAFKLPAE